MNHDEFQRCLRTLRADPLGVGRTAAQGGRAIGYVGNDVPVELILATKALPVRLRGLPGRDISSAERFVESSFTPELRSIAAQWLAGELDFLEAVVFARSDDSSQRLYYYVCELQRRGLCRGPRALLFDVANLPGEASSLHTLDSTRRLAAELGVVTMRLEAARHRVQRRATLLRAVRARRLQSAPLAGSLAWLLDRAAAADWREEFDTRAQQWLHDAPTLAAPQRVLLAGDPPADDEIHLAIERNAASVVVESTESAVHEAVEDPDALAAIAAEQRGHESPALSMRRNGRWLADQARDHHVDKVVVFMSEQNEALPWEIARQTRALRDAGIPFLTLPRQPWRPAASAVAAIADFVRSGKSS